MAGQSYHSKIACHDKQTEWKANHHLHGSNFLQHHCNHQLASLTCLMGVPLGCRWGFGKNGRGKTFAKDCLFHVQKIDLLRPGSCFPTLCGTLEFWACKGRAGLSQMTSIYYQLPIRVFSKPDNFKSAKQGNTKFGFHHPLQVQTNAAIAVHCTLYISSTLLLD